MASAKSKASAVLPALLLAVLTVILYFVTYQVFCAALVAITAWNSVVKVGVVIFLLALASHSTI